MIVRNHDQDKDASISAKACKFICQLITGRTHGFQYAISYNLKDYVINSLLIWLNSIVAFALFYKSSLATDELVQNNHVLGVNWKASDDVVDAISTGLFFCACTLVLEWIIMTFCSLKVACAGSSDRFTKANFISVETGQCIQNGRDDSIVTDGIVPYYV